MTTFKAVLALGVAFFSAASAEETLELSSAFQRDVPVVGEQSGRFVDIFNDISEDLKFRFHPPGALAPVSQMLEVVSEGHVAAAFSLAGYWQDRIPSAALFSSFPFGFDPLERLDWLHEGNGLTLYQEMYDRAGYNVKVIPCGMSPAETSGWFKHEINSPEDLDGLRMRVFGFGSEVFQTFGVETELVYADGLSHALKRGRLDAAEFSTLAADVFLGLQEYTSYFYFPGWHQPSTLFELLLNKDVWDGLEPRERHLVETACSANILENLANAETRNQQALADLTAHGDAQLRIWSPEMLSAFSDAWNAVVAQHVKDDKFFRTVWEDIEQFRDAREEWKRAANWHFGPTRR